MVVLRAIDKMARALQAVTEFIESHDWESLSARLIELESCRPERIDYVAHLVRDVPKSVPMREREIASGAFGKIFSASMIGAARRLEVAIKVIAAHGQQRGAVSVNEAAIMTSVAQAINDGRGLGRFKGTSRLMPSIATSINPRGVMSLVLPKGICDLSHIVRTTGVSLLPHTLKQFSSEIISGMLELHANGIVHSDIKATNVILFPNAYPQSEDELIIRTFFRVALNARQEFDTNFWVASLLVRAIACGCLFTSARLTDYGLCRFVESEDSGVITTVHGAAFTASCCPPEKWRQERWSYPADVWALGCTLYEMLFRRPLFREHRSQVRQDAGIVREAHVQARQVFAASFDLSRDDFCNPSPYTPDSTLSVSVTNTFNHVRHEFRDLWHASTLSEADFLNFRKLIGACLQYAPEERICSLDIPAHAWMASMDESLHIREQAYPTLTVWSADKHRIQEKLASFPFRERVAELAGWIYSNISARVDTCKSLLRIRKMSNEAFQWFAIAMAGKMLMMFEVVDAAANALKAMPIEEVFSESRFVQPSLVRDEPALYSAIGFHLFPF